MKPRSELFDEWGSDRGIRLQWQEEAKLYTKDEFVRELARIYIDWRQGKVWDWHISWLAIARTEARRRGITLDEVVAKAVAVRLELVE